MLIGQVLVHAGEQASALGAGEVDPELLLWGVVTDVRTPWPRCMNNRWRRQLHASVGLPKGYRGAAGPLLGSLGVNLDELAGALLAEQLACPRRTVRSSQMKSSESSGARCSAGSPSRPTRSWTWPEGLAAWPPLPRLRACPARDPRRGPEPQAAQLLGTLGIDLDAVRRDSE